jgi:Apea-like HEPN
MNDERVGEVESVDRQVPESTSAKAAASANPSIPEGNRSPSLRESVRYFVDVTAQFKEANTDFPHQTNLFYFLTYPWVVETAGNAEIETALEQQRQELTGRGFNGVQVRARLDQILREDSHLSDCCTNTAFLAYYLDTGFVGLAASFADINGLKEETYNLLLDSFIKTTYVSPFRKQAVSHIFNFDTDEDSLEFDGIRVVKLDAATVSRLLGEPTFPSFIHPPGVGDYFILTEEGGPSNDVITWLHNERNKAEEFAGMLQYFKDGIVHVDYTVPHFLPLWVNNIRKRGIFFIGDPHRVPYAGGQRTFRIDALEAAKVNDWRRVYAKVAGTLENQGNKVRQVLLRAGTYYERHHERSDSVARLIDLAIALEALFTPSDKGELTYRIAYSASYLVGGDSEERKALFRFVRDIYRKRNMLFHGQYDVNDYNEGKFVTDDEIEKLASIIRVSILRLTVLYLKGNDNLEELRALFSDCVLDPKVAESLREESDPERFVNEFPDKKPVDSLIRPVFVKAVTAEARPSRSGGKAQNPKVGD